MRRAVTGEAEENGDAEAEIAAASQGVTVFNTAKDEKVVSVEHIEGEDEGAAEGGADGAVEGGPEGGEEA
jgi:DNA gyrase subunit A